MEPGRPPRGARPRPWLALALTAPAWLAACLGASLAACKVTEDFGRAERHLLASAPPLAVTLSPELNGLRKRSVASGGRTVYKVGHLLRRLFPGSDGHAFLSLVGSDMEVAEEYSGLWSARFALELALQLGGEHHAIQVRGTGESPVGAREAGKLAIEDGIEQVYQRLFVLVGPLPVASAGNGSQ